MSKKLPELFFKISMIVSHPLNFMGTEKKPPAWLSPIVPVNGLLAVTATLLIPLIGSPVRADTENTKIFLGDRGSIPGIV